MVSTSKEGGSNGKSYVEVVILHISLLRPCNPSIFPKQEAPGSILLLKGITHLTLPPKKEENIKDRPHFHLRQLLFKGTLPGSFAPFGQAAI